MRVSVICAEVDKVFDVELELPAGSTVRAAIDASRIREHRPDIEIRADRVGVFSRRATFDTPLRNGDRVEIYRPLRIDPKEARRKRARARS
ncbi:MAG TPA: RnfH family protein [Rhodanobacteraceae bacterium]|nr:RnfH family protein [Rhodanobacteraceae bacterium]